MKCSALAVACVLKQLTNFVFRNKKFPRQKPCFIRSFLYLSQGLVDYEGDSDEEEEEEGGDVLSPSPKRARLT